MPLPTYLHLRGNTYYVRRPIPPDVRHAFEGKSEVWESLRTTDRRTAVARSHAVLASLSERMDAARRAAGEGAAERAFLRSTPVYGAIRDHSVLATRMGTGTPVPPWQAESPEHYELLASMVRLGQVASPPASRREALARIEADLRQIDVEEASATLVTGVDEDGEPIFSVPERHVPAVMAFIRELLDADRRSMEATQAAIAELPKGPEPKSPRSTRPTLSVLASVWKEQRNPATTTQADMRTAIARFERVNGALTYSEVTDEHARRFKADLLGAADIKNATRQKLWSMLRTLFGVAVDDGLLPGNPFVRIKLRLDDDAATRETLTEEDLRAFFAVLTDREEWWIARLALYSGARLGEIVQLTQRDLQTVSGVPVLNIRPDDATGKRVKTRSSIRKVPIHRQLLADGFLEWAEARSTDALFKIGSQPASKRMARRMEAAGLGDGKVFHSLRHTFKGVARRHMPQEWHDRLTGHAAKSVGQGYGDYDVRTLKDYLDKVTFGIERATPWA